jgi:DNA repair protein RadA/Sms
MPAQSLIFNCSHCGAQFSKWTGRCLECGSWGTILKDLAPKQKEQTKNQTYASTPTVSLEEILKKTVERIKTHSAEFDRVLGGGIVPGSLTLLGGNPGIGKSTLALQLALLIPKTLYISGEESTEQIKLRAERLQKTTSSTMRLANEPVVEKINATIRELKPPLVIIDSIQTLTSEEAEGEPGALSQIKTATAKILETAKSTNTAIVIIGHVTKEGVVSGPKTLEHLVDTVLYLEGDNENIYRILRTVKNRFGPTDEIGIFEMKEYGLEEVKNPSLSFLSDRGVAVAGNVLTCLIEGTRPIVVEVQALVTKTAFGYPTRKVHGIDLNKLFVLLAVLQKRGKLPLEQYDVHVNVVGGLQIHEPAVDLAIAAAVASSFKDHSLGNDIIFFGEIGLGGEIRPVSQLERRIKECEKLGFKKIITNTGKHTTTQKNVSVTSVKHILDIIKS